MDASCIKFGVGETGCTLISVGLYFGYFLFFLAVGALVVLVARNVLQAPKEMAKSLMAVVALIVIFGISYAISGDEVTMKAASLGVDASSSKMIGAGLIMFYIAFFVSLGGLLYSFFHKAIK